MAVTRANFQAAFPAFADLSKFPDAALDFWIEQAGIQLNAGRLGASIDLATMLFVAHNLTLGVREAAAGASAGTVQGPVNSKSIDKVSVGYDTGSVTLDGAGMWNATTYGVRLYKMLQAASTGPVYVNTRRRSPF